MDSIAHMSMDMSASRTAMGYSLALTKKVMDSQELAAQELLAMLPQAPAQPPLGQFIDTYA